LDELFVHTNSLKFTPEQTYGTEAIQCYRQTNCKVESLKLLSGCNNNLDCCSTYWVNLKPYWCRSIILYMCLGIRGCKQHSGRLDKLKVDTLLVRVSATFGHVGNAAYL